MTVSRSKVAAAAAVVVLLTTVSWLVLEGAGSRGPQAPGSAPARIDAGEVHAAAASATSADRPVPAAVARETVDPPGGPATTGSLMVRVRWGDDGQPAGDVPIFLAATRDGDRLEWTGRTGSDGSARFEALPPGVVRVDTGRSTGGSSASTEIAAGRESAVTLELRMGMNVRGLVVDTAGAPVPGADVVVAGWAAMQGAIALARTDADGRFELRAVSARCSVGARAPGHAPSLLQSLTGSDGASMSGARAALARAGPSRDDASPVRFRCTDPRQEALCDSLTSRACSRSPFSARWSPRAPASRRTSSTTRPTTSRG